MASRQNKESRDAPTYGAPMGPPPVDTERERKRKEKLETRATPEKRRRLIEEHEEQGQEDTAKLRRNRTTQAPKPTKPLTITDTEGKSTTEVIKDRKRDIDDTLTEMETGESRPDRETDAERRRREKREREKASKPLRRRPPKQ